MRRLFRTILASITLASCTAAHADSSVSIGFGMGFGGYGPHNTYGAVGVSSGPYYPRGGWGAPYWGPAWGPWWDWPYGPYGYYPPDPPVITPRVVVAPEEGAIVPYLPERFEAQVIDGTTYFVADGVYYKAVAEGYRVMSAPPGGGSGRLDDIVAVPALGQRPPQQQIDRDDCQAQARDAMGPTGDGFRRAVQACLAARGYSIR
ncbi:hypothetical protein ACDA63_13985 [Uliginosibacterium sp. sgz301328]|uniref:hypothetical protein n=1 Tax=Uliginosibacterium sp. sgz301328 TaxID=3243764 RepID=UPI00359E86D6